MTSKIQNVICVIPAHMASVRFPGKILFPFFGYPMIEHVRRRAQNFSPKELARYLLQHVTQRLRELSQISGVM